VGLCGHSIHTGCQKEVGGVASSDNMSPIHALFCIPDSSSTCTPWSSQRAHIDSHPPADLRSLCKACASGFLEAPAQERSGWPRYRSEEHEKHKAAYLLRHEARETSGHPYQRRRLLLRRPASVSVYLRLSPEVNGAMASRLHFVHFTFEN
jgi:hypothetical protein